MTLTQQQIAAIGGEGIIKAEDLPHLCHCERLIEQMLISGEWLTIYDFQQAAPNAFDVQRRMREARRKLEMLGWQSERKLHSVTPRVWAYRVTKLEVTA